MNSGGSATADVLADVGGENPEWASQLWVTSIESESNVSRPPEEYTQHVSVHSY